MFTASYLSTVNSMSLRTTHLYKNRSFHIINIKYCCHKNMTFDSLKKSFYLLINTIYISAYFLMLYEMCKFGSLLRNTISSYNITNTKHSLDSLQLLILEDSIILIVHDYIF